MKAAQINAYGGQAVVAVTEQAETPVAGEGQVLVKVHAAGVNPFDYKVREGFVRQMAELNFPATLGGDVAGEVTAVGPGVTTVQIGDAVFGQAGALSGHGSFAEFTPVKAESLAAKPQTIDYLTAAGLPLVGVSAYQAPVDTLNLLADQKILIHGAAGGIGSVAVQLAKQLGAYVAATARAEDAEFVKSLGADEVIDYQQEDFAQLLKDYDAVFDTVGGDTNVKSYTILKPGGALVSMMEQPDEALVSQYDISYSHQFTQVTTERLEKLAALVDDGAIKLTVDKVFPLDQAAEALEYVKTGHPRGKVVIQVD